MYPHDFCFGNGKVVYWEMDAIDPQKKIAQQVEELKEDLAQIRFGNRKLLDIGWYPEFSKNGTFVVTLILDENWDEPLAREICNSIKELQDVIKQVANLAES